MEIGIPREGSNERTRARRARRKASKARKVAIKAAMPSSELVTVEGKFQLVK